MTDTIPYRSSVVFLACFLWLAAAVVLGASGMPQRLHPPQPQLILVGLTLLLLIAAFALPRLRAWFGVVDVRVLVALHLTRFVGFYFLLLYSRGDLPGAFAVAAGWGDNAVATFAVILLVLGPPTVKYRRRLYLLWNVFGLIDILLVVATAARIGISDPAAMRALLTMPLCLLPTFLVPLIIVSHIVLFTRLARIRG